MECPECFEGFDEIGHLPKALPCGHTFCLACLENVDQCYQDHKEFLEIPTELPNNHNVLAMMRSRSSNRDKRLSVWCMSCGVKASESCIDLGHKVCSRKRVLFEQAREKMHLSDNESFLHHCYDLVDQLDEGAATEALEFLSGGSASGRIAPLSVLLQGRAVRWIASPVVAPQPEEEAEAQKAKLMRLLLLLMRVEGTVPKDLYPPPAEPGKPESNEVVDPDTVLDVTNISSGSNNGSDKMALLASDSLLKVKKLTGLYCDRDTKWSQQLLEALAPKLEEVHLYNFNLKHLEVVHKMPQLRWLVLEHLGDKISKEGTQSYELPPLHHESKVEFLWCNVSCHKHEKLCFDIIRLYATSLKTLFTTTPSFHRSCVKLFKTLTMPNLNNLFYLSDYCAGDHCRNLMDDLRDEYPKLNIFCFRCGRTNNYDE